MWLHPTTLVLTESGCGCRCVEWLIEEGAEVNPARDANNRTALHGACETGHSSAAWALLKAGADYTQRLDGNDIVALAANAGYRAMAADLSANAWLLAGGAAGELALGETPEDSEAGTSTLGEDDATDDGEEEDESKLLLLDRAATEPLWSWITASFTEKEKISADELLSMTVDGSTLQETRAIYDAEQTALKKRKEQDDYRYGSLPRDSRIAQQLKPRAEAATAALTAAERAMWDAQLHCDLTCFGRSTQKLRGPPPVSLTKPDDDLVAPETVRQERLDNARTRCVRPSLRFILHLLATNSSFFFRDQCTIIGASFFAAYKLCKFFFFSQGFARGLV